VLVHCDNQVPRVRAKAPDFKSLAVRNGDFVDVSLADFHGKWLVLFFYPMDFTFVCPTEILAFNDRLAEFEAINTKVVGVSTDSEFTHLAWTNTGRKIGGIGKIGFPLVADKSHTVAKKYGVLIEEEGIALRGLFIIAPDGILRQVTINDLPVGRSVDETLRLVKAFQFTDQFGEVCPAGWQPGADTIKPDPAESLNYFAKCDD